MSDEVKATNPKDAVGIAKVPFSTIPAQVLGEIGLGLMEGARKYGRHNYRVAGVRASVYYDAAQRHQKAWWEGQDTDALSRLNHITKAITTLIVLRDSMLMGNWVDDRPPRYPNSETWIEEHNAHARWLIEQFPDPIPPHTEKDRP